MPRDREGQRLDRDPWAGAGLAALTRLSVNEAMPPCLTMGLVTDLFSAPGPAVLAVLALWRAALIAQTPST